MLLARLCLHRTLLERDVGIAGVGCSKATGSYLGDLPASRSPSGCSRDTKNYGPSDVVGLIDHGKGWHWRQHLVTCHERSGWVTGDFVVRTAPARTILCSPFNSSGGREFSLDLLQCIQQRRGKKVSFLPACQSGIPAGWALLPSQRRRCQPPRGEAAGLTAPSSFIA